jgi:hypothetical protein
LLRVLPPLGIVAVGLVAVVLGVQFSETAPPPPAPPKPEVVAQARRPPAKVVARAAPPRPVAKLPPPPAPPPEIVLLTVAAAPPLNTMLLPQLAAGYLTIGRQAQPLIGSIGDAVHVAVPEGGKLLAIVVREAPAGDQAIVDAADIACSVGPAAPDPRKPARLALGAMPAEPHAPVGCALGDTGAATEFGLFLATPAAKQIVAQEGYAPPPPPPAPPPQAKPAAKPAAKVALAKGGPAKVGPVKAGPGKQAAAKPSPAKAAPKTEAPDEETPDKAAPGNEAPAAAAPAVADNDDDSTPPATPRVVKLPADSQLTAASLKAMTTPDDLSGPAHDDSETAPKPRTVVLPASAQISFAPYQGVKIPAEKLQFHSIGAGETHAPGDVHADCKIGLDGIPTDCRQISHSGTQQEADAILAWLPSGGIRYTPAQKDGHPVAERRVLTVKFGGGKEGQGALPPGPPLRTSP